jgi:hypothetical protein
MRGVSNRAMCGAIALLALLLTCGVRAEEVKATDEGKAEEFKAKTFDLKDKGKIALALSFPAGKKFSVTVRGEKKTDINLYVLDSAGKEVAKDDSPGPNCDLTVSSAKDEKYTLEIRNLGPGANRAVLKVELAP